MTWIKFSDRKPEHKGTYAVVKLIKGTPAAGFFQATPPSLRVEHLNWIETLQFHSQTKEKVTYSKEKIFVNEHQIEIDPTEILYWYELEPIPEINDVY